MLKNSAEPFTVMGREIESQTTFVASDTGSGTVEMSFTFRRSILSDDLTLVAFEKLFDTKGNLIGAHEDINDEAQTVTVKKTNPELPSTKVIFSTTAAASMCRMGRRFFIQQRWKFAANRGASVESLALYRISNCHFGRGTLLLSEKA